MSSPDVNSPWPDIQTHPVSSSIPALCPCSFHSLCWNICLDCAHLLSGPASTLLSSPTPHPDKPLGSLELAFTLLCSLHFFAYHRQFNYWKPPYMSCFRCVGFNETVCPLTLSQNSLYAPRMPPQCSEHCRALGNTDGFDWLSKIKNVSDQKDA